jgi:hypothetical protein
MVPTLRKGLSQRTAVREGESHATNATTGRSGWAVSREGLRSDAAEQLDQTEKAESTSPSRTPSTDRARQADPNELDANPQHKIPRSLSIRHDTRQQTDLVTTRTLEVRCHAFRCRTLFPSNEWVFPRNRPSPTANRLAATPPRHALRPANRS